MKLHVLFSASALALGLFSHAQNVAPFWSAVGNSNATTASKLGTTNAIPLNFYTTNALRMSVAAGGNVGIGTNNPIYKLHVEGGSGTAAIYGKTSGKFALYGAGGTYGVYGAGTYGVAGSGSSYGVWGTTPNGYAGYFTSSSGYGLYASSGYIGIYSYGTTYGIYGGGSTYGVYGSGSTAGVYGAASSLDKAAVYGNGSYAFGVQGASQANYGGYFTSVNLHGIYAKTSSTNASAYAAVFQGNTYSYGAYITSDERVKKNITEFKEGMALINQLQPKTYEFASEGKMANLNLPKGSHYGFLASEVQKIFPDLVREAPLEVQNVTKQVDLNPGPNGPDTAALRQLPTSVKRELMQVKAVNYIELIPIIVKGMQEVDAENKDLRSEVAELKDQLIQLKQMVQNLSGGGPVTLAETSLLQNQPNPFNGSTIIPLNIPLSASNGLLTVTEAGSGKVVKMQTVAPGSKQVSLDGSVLANGTYIYTLTVDGKKLSRKMTVQK